MAEPHPFPCGGEGQPACPPEPAAVHNLPWYTREEMLSYGAQCWQQAIAYCQNLNTSEHAPGHDRTPQPATGAGEEQ